MTRFTHNWGHRCQRCGRFVDDGICGCGGDGRRGMGGSSKRALTAEEKNLSAAIVQFWSNMISAADVSEILGGKLDEESIESLWQWRLYTYGGPPLVDARYFADDVVRLHVHRRRWWQFWGRFGAVSSFRRRMLWIEEGTNPADDDALADRIGQFWDRVEPSIRDHLGGRDPGCIFLIESIRSLRATSLGIVDVGDTTVPPTWILHAGWYRKEDDFALARKILRLYPVTANTAAGT